MLAVPPAVEEPPAPPTLAGADPPAPDADVPLPEPATAALPPVGVKFALPSVELQPNTAEAKQRIRAREDFRAELRELSKAARHSGLCSA